MSISNSTVLECGIL